MSKWIIVANGQSTDKKKLQELAANKKILLCDGAMNCWNTTLPTPDIVMGDFDSIKPDLLNDIKKNNDIKIIRANNQNLTDLEKAIIYLDETNVESIDICAADGDRADHTLYNFMLLKKYHNIKRKLTIHTQLDSVSYHETCHVHLSGKINERVSLFGFETATVCSVGLHYELNNYELSSTQASVSNALRQTHSSVDIIGKLLMITEADVKISQIS